MSVPIVFVAFVTGGLTAAAGVADYHGISGQGLVRRSLQVVVLSGVGIAGLLVTPLVYAILSPPVSALLEPVSEVEDTVFTQFCMAIGMTLVVGGYLALTDRDLSFIDLRRPTLRDIGWTVGGLVVLFGALFVISVVMQSAGVESADHSTTQRLRRTPNSCSCWCRSPS